MKLPQRVEIHQLMVVIRHMMIRWQLLVEQIMYNEVSQMAKVSQTKAKHPEVEPKPNK